MITKRAYLGGVVLAAVLALAAEAAPGIDARPDYPKLFNTNETRSTNLKPFPKWTEMLMRHLAEERKGDAPCTTTPFERCPIQKWKEFLDSQQGKPPREQVDAVNRQLNLHRYVLDIVNYGVEDYWATPREFAIHDGDCEDFAIAKYISLKVLGWSDADLRVVVLQDLNLKVAHAVLAVYLDGQALILDNQTRQVLASEAIRHYRPYYSVNETGWWLHKP
jgi:predicted transglutaminase-like cysteine proteinase